ncbi:universal stress protein [Luteimonas dalianensis]|uniref:universal stress protein n=1 Tax=Luteimonas dalianensis TaxID=1148196 RepID=UPI003BF311C6
MYTHLLLPTDGSPLSSDALERGLALAKTLGARVTILTVVEPFYLFTASEEHLGETREQYEKFAREAASTILKAAKERAAELGVQAQVKLVGSEHPDQAIIDAVKESGCDLVAMASHGRRGVNALLLGSVTQQVLTRSSVPVLVFRPAT